MEIYILIFFINDNNLLYSCLENRMRNLKVVGEINEKNWVER